MREKRAIDIDVEVEKEGTGIEHESTGRYFHDDARLPEDQPYLFVRLRVT